MTEGNACNFSKNFPNKSVATRLTCSLKIREFLSITILFVVMNCLSAAIQPRTIILKYFLILTVSSEVLPYSTSYYWLSHKTFCGAPCLMMLSPILPERLREWLPKLRALLGYSVLTPGSDAYTNFR